jgi:hypothetical protein
VNDGKRFKRIYIMLYVTVIITMYKSKTFILKTYNFFFVLNFEFWGKMVNVYYIYMLNVPHTASSHNTTVFMIFFYI